GGNVIVGGDEQAEGLERGRVPGHAVGCSWRPRTMIDGEIVDGYEGEALEHAVRAHEARHVLVGRPQQEIHRTAVLDEASPLLHDRDASADLDRLIDIVGDEYHRRR